MNEIITIENSANLCIKGATKVVSSTTSQAIVETTENTIIISGEGLEVRKLDLENNEVVFLGKITNIKFSAAGGAKTPFLKRIFR